MFMNVNRIGIIKSTFGDCVWEKKMVLMRRDKLSINFTHQ